MSTPFHRPAPVRGLLLLVALAVPAAAPAAPPSLTLYTHDLGLVRETRVLEPGAGRDTVRITDVPERIDFSSVRLVPAGSAHVTRLAYRWDVATGDALIESARGRRVRVSSRGDRTAEGVLVAADGAWLVVRADDGAMLSVSRAAVEEVRLAVPPAGLSVRPTLEAVLEGGGARVDAELTYLTGGLSWSAEHVVVRRGENTATWSANVTVENTTGRAYEDARLKLVAGEPRRDVVSPPMPYARAQMVMSVADKSAAPDLSEQTFSEYHLYTLDRPATLRDRESQSFSMIAPHAVKTTPIYLYRGGDPRGVMTQLEVVNSKTAGPGVPLPAGRVRFYEADPSGALQFTGETHIAHTPVDEKLTLDMGVAFDLAAERKETDGKRISDREREYSVEITLRNRKAGAVTIRVEENVGGDFEVTQQTQAFTRKDAGTIRFDVPVPAGKSVTLGYTVHTRY
jgi:hypothetical protein